MPVTFGQDYVIFSTTAGPIRVPASSDYKINVQPEDQDPLQYSLQDLTKIDKIVKNAELHGPKTLQQISDKLRADCT